MLSLRDQLHLLRIEYSDPTRDDVLNFTLQAADNAFKCLKAASTAEERNEAKLICNILLDEASRMKETVNYAPSIDDILACIRPTGAFLNKQPPASSRSLTKREQIILLQASTLNNAKFWPWQEDPALDEFMKPGDYDDMHELSMSLDQLELLDAWKRPDEANIVHPQNHQDASLMRPAYAVDLVQEAGTDCSIVAALSAASASNGKIFPEMLQRRLFPYDPVKKTPLTSQNGKYIARLYFNGCDRKVVIDDRLPFSKNDTLLHIVDRHNAALLWPALLEKAYLKVRGGYDFPGSNSGTDLWMLAGWIPEEIFFSNDKFDPEHTWRQLQNGLEAGTLVATLGTGQMSEDTSQSLGLVSNHNYAILGHKIQDDRLHVLIKNPWVNGLTWKDHHQTEDDQSKKSPEGCFWMSVSAVVQHFVTLYINWDPRLYKFREDVHFSWNLDESTDLRTTRADFAGMNPFGSMLASPQYVVENRSDKPTEALVIVSKYFKDKSHDSPDREEFMSLYAFKSDGRRVLRRIDAFEHNEYSSSTHSLLRINLEARERITTVVSQQQLAATEYSFTLSCFANTRLALYRAASPYTNSIASSGSWTTSTSGGHYECPEHTKNPQFNFTIDEPTHVALMVETLHSDLDIHVRLLHGKGHRCHEYSKKDVILDSGDYRRQYALAELRNELLEPGSYTAICSVFHAGATGDFKLTALTDCRATLVPLPRDGAGMFCKQLANADIGGNTRCVRAPMQLNRETKLYFTARILTSPDSPRSATPMRITLDEGSGPNRRIYIASNKGQFTLSNKGYRTEPLSLTPHMVKKKYIWLSVERLSGTEGPRGHHEVVEIEMWHDTPDAAEFGVWRDRDP